MTDSLTRRTAIVIGGGVSGLLAARQLRAAGLRVTLLEAREHLGGAVGAHEVASLMLDSGAESFATRSTAVSALIEELGLKDKIVTPNPLGSWLYLPQGARKMPSSGIMGIPGNLNDKSLIDVLGKGGLRRAQLDRVLPIAATEKIRTLGELVRVRMGRAVLDNLVAPVVSGVYSSHPDSLDIDATIPGLRAAMRTHRSLAGASAALRAASPAGSQVASLAGGMNQLTEALIRDIQAAGVRIIPGFDVIAVDRDPATGQWLMIQKNTVGGDKIATARADYLVIASDGPTTARLLAPHIDGPALPVIEPGPEVALVTLVVDQKLLNSNPRGTGLLVSDQVRGVRAKALTHASAKWDWVRDATIDSRHVVRLSYGRGGEDSRFNDVSLSDEQLITLGMHDATKLMGVPITGEQLVDADVIRWRGVLPAATPGYRDRVQNFRTRAAELDNVCIIGSWAAGSGLVKVVGDTTTQVQGFLKRHSYTDQLHTA